MENHVKTDFSLPVCMDHGLFDFSWCFVNELVQINTSQKTIKSKTVQALEKGKKADHQTGWT